MGADIIKVTKPHSVELSGRKKATITGVIEVIGIAETSVTVDTSDGGLVLTGREIRVNRFNKEEGFLVLDGEFSGLKYTEKRDARGMFGKLFK